MGMFDYVDICIYKLPEHLQYEQTGWQTKSLDCGLSTYLIMDGKITLIRDMDGNPKDELVDYTGEIRMINKKREIVAWCVKGFVKEIIDVNN